MKMIILEGLPMVGKTTIIQYIKSLCIDNVNCVDELIIDTKELDQDSFMKNDLMKINKYDSSLVFIDKGLISTLSYNEMLDFAKKCLENGIKTTLSIVTDYDNEVDVEKCREIAQKTGAQFRERPWIKNGY